MIILLLQYNNNQTFCDDIVGQEEKVYNVLVATDHNSTEPVLACLRDRLKWEDYQEYPFNTSSCVNYTACDFYTSLYTSVIDK